MVDTPPAKNFIVVIAFLVIWAALTGFLPIQLVEGDQEYRNPVNPETYWGLDDLEVISTSYTINMSDGGGYFQEDWGIDEGFGHNFLLKANVVSGELKIENQHYYLFTIFPHGHHSMDWTAKSTGENYGGFLIQSEFDEVSETDEEANITFGSFTVACEHVSLHAVLAYNASDYDNATDAFENDELSLEFAIEWDELGTGLNAWNMITSILFFQAPNVNVYVNVFLAAPLWSAIAYLAYCFIMVAISVLPFT